MVGKCSGEDMPKHLEQRGRVSKLWYATLDIPKPLRPKFGGKRRFIQSLQTDSLKLAEIRKGPLISEWKRLIELVRTGHEGVEGIVADMRIEGGAVMGQLEHLAGPEFVADLGKTISRTVGKETLGDDWLPAWDVATGKRLLLSEHLSAYMGTQGELTAKSRDMKLGDLKRFNEQFCYADEVTRRAVVKWVDSDLMGKDGLSATTCRRIISNCRGFWNFLIDRRDLEAPDPFNKVVPVQKKTKKSSSEERKPFTQDDLSRVFLAIPAEDSALRNLVLLAAYTGARIEELCSLRLENVTPEALKIDDSKTAAGQREVPIHATIKDLVAKLKATSTDGYLLTGLTFNKYGDRSNAIGKRFGRLKRSVGFDERYVFHSIRKGVSTQLEQQGVPENVSARLLGHDIPTMTYGLYSGGNLPLKDLEYAINQIDWPSVDQSGQ